MQNDVGIQVQKFLLMSRQLDFKAGMVRNYELLTKELGMAFKPMQYARMVTHMLLSFGMISCQVLGQKTFPLSISGVYG